MLQFINDMAFFVCMMVLAVGGSIVMWLGIVMVPTNLAGVVLFAVGAAALYTFGNNAQQQVV